MPGQNRRCPTRQIGTPRHNVPASGSLNGHIETTAARRQNLRAAESAQARIASGCGAESKARNPKNR